MKLFLSLLFGIICMSFSPYFLSLPTSNEETFRISFVSTTYADDTITFSAKVKIPGCDWNKEKETCTIKKWFAGVMMVIGALIKYATYLTFLAWVLFLVIQWILLAAGSAEVEVIKKRIIFWIIGIALLSLSWVILNIIAPWVYV